MKYKYIILLTDFGIEDNFVGVMKGVIYNINHNVKIIDLTHNITSQNIFEAAFLLKHSYSYFPEKSIFLNVVDPGVGTDRKILIAEIDKKLFIAPDNGLLTFIIDENKDNYKLYSLKNEFLKNLTSNISNTFHGRDIFAPTGAIISKGIKLLKISNRISTFKRINYPTYKFNNKKIIGEIIYIDKFGNCISNLPASLLNKFNKLNIKIKNITINTLSNNYNIEKRIGAIINSFNLLEIFSPSNSAANKFKIKIGDKIIINKI